ncbi:MAG: TonB-dependent receptor [Candidatus Acidiferrales bacterium]
MRGKFLFCIASVLVLIAFTAGTSSAQFSGNIQGIVTDSSGAAAPGVSVQLRNLDTGIEQTASTSDSGNYRFSSLEPGRYTVTASKSGFRTTEVNLTLGTAETQAINVTLPIASATETVNVTTQAPILDTDETRLQATLSSQTVKDLPTINRNLWDLVTVTPGVVGTGTRGAGEAPGGNPDNFGTQTPQISANGRSYTGNTFFVDGMNVTSPVQNGNIILAPIPDAVQEVTMQANTWDAENALGSSVVVQLTTKSGTNQYHGTGSLLYTNQDLQAVPDYSSLSPFGRKDLVGTFGGPIIKNKTFFFADVEKLWATLPETSSGQISWDDPAFDSWAQSNFPNTVGTSILSLYPTRNLKPNGTVETAQQYFNLTSCPASGVIPVAPGTATIPCGTNVLDFGSQVVSPYYNALQYNFRVDQYFTPSDRLYVSYYNDSFSQQAISRREGLNTLNSMSNRYGQVDYTHTFNSNVLLEGSIAFASVGGAQGLGADLKVPEVDINDGTTGFNAGGWGPGEFRGPNYNWRAVLSWIRGAHTFKFGYNGDHAIEHGDFTPVNVRPVFTFNSIFDVVQDNPVKESVGAYNPLTGNPGLVNFGGQTNPFGFFAQDDWKVKSNLSVTLALRWDDFTNHTPWGNSGFQFSSILLGPGSNLSTQIANASVSPVSGVFTPNYPQSNYWSPRIGFAWDPSKTGKWSIRGGVGVYRDWIVLGQTVDQTRNNPPGVVSPVFTEGGTGIQPIFALSSTGSYPYNFPLPVIPAGSLDPKGGLLGVPSAVTALQRNITAPLAVNYVIGVERELPWKLVAGANYSGSRSYDGLTGSDQNRCAGCAVQSGANGITINRPNTSFGPMTYVTDSNRSTYNALILTLRGNPDRRFNFQASYTLSHAMDFPEANTRFDQDANLNIPDQNAYFSYWGDSNWDVRQRFAFSEVYTLPGMASGIGSVLTKGWSISGLGVIQSGTPFWVYNTNSFLAAINPGDYNMDGTDWDVPDAPSSNFTGSHSREAYRNGIFTAADFPVPAPGTEGDLKRNIYRNPGFFEVDASVMKNTHLPKLGEAGNFQLRFDFLNLFNHVNLGPVNNNMAASNFGTVTTALPARQLQLGVRVEF